MEAAPPPSMTPVVWGLVVLVLATSTAAMRTFALWRRSAASERRNAERTLLLIEATRELDTIDDAHAVLCVLPRLANRIMRFRRATVLVPDGDRVRPIADLGGEIVAADVTKTSPALSLPSDGRRSKGSHSELVFPIVVDDALAAIVEFEREAIDAFDASDGETLEAFARLVGDRLQWLRAMMSLRQQRREWELVARLQARLQPVETMAEAARIALAALLEGLGLDAGLALTLQSDRFRTLARRGDVPRPIVTVAAEGLPTDAGRVAEAWEGRRALFVDDYADGGKDPRFRGAGLRAAAFVPVLDGGSEPMTVLVLCSFRAPRAWTADDRRLVETAGRALGGAFERVRLTQQLNELLSISRRLTQADDPERLYAEVAEAAVRVIPGADAASIMIRGADGYRFVASMNHDLEMLRTMPALSEATQIAWHGLGARAFANGTPRVLRGSEIATVSLSTGTDDSQQRHALMVGGNVTALRANLCVPVTDGSSVIGLLNVDSLSRSDAFGPSSLRLAEAFAQQAGVIIRQAIYRDALERSAVTDPVTKLGNREGFNQRLQVELARAQRHGHRLSVVMLDLNGFKDVNDRLGHQAGDRALLLVADAMRRERRPFDGLFRWGGDEFAVILPEVGPTGAGAGAQRYADAISEVEVGGLRMSTSYGTASFPEDGEDADTLLRRADDLMYRYKDGYRAVQEP